MAHAPPTIGEWRAFYARFIKLITRHHGRKDESGKFAARLLREVDSLWLFLEKGGVSPTNNHAEWMLRFPSAGESVATAASPTRDSVGLNGFSPCGRPVAYGPRERFPCLLRLSIPISKNKSPIW